MDRSISGKNIRQLARVHWGLLTGYRWSWNMPMMEDVDRRKMNAAVSTWAGGGGGPGVGVGTGMGVGLE